MIERQSLVANERRALLFLKKTWEQVTNLNNAPTTKTLLSKMVYNEIGQLAVKKLHNTDSVNYLQSIAYSYNERGWLRQSSAPLFEMQLRYNTLSPNKQYNSNIPYQQWGTAAAPNTNTYTYTYDKLNRLTGGSSIDGYQETGINYDLNGNITALSRYQATTLIDNLTYTYNSTNQAQTIADASSSNLGLVNLATNYTYDGNGNTLTNANTANTGQNKTFTYNLLNLPKTAVTTLGGSDTYTYDATGQKLRKVNVNGTITTTADYIAGIQYKNGALDFIQTEEGKLTTTGGTNIDYYYYLGDNLGNTRVTFDTQGGTANQQQKDDYYPFGLEISRGSVVSPKNEYLYNRKELQEELGLYDYGHRYYDPITVRWNTIDPLAEISRRWSPYNYVEDNPIKFTDPDGDSVVYGANSITLNGKDAANFATNLKIHGKRGDGGSDNKKKQDEKGAKAPQQTTYKKWIRATPVLGLADKAGDELKDGQYVNSALDEGSAILEMLMFVPGRLADAGVSVMDYFAGLFTKDATTIVEDETISYSEKTLLSFEKQLEQGGMKSLLKSESSIQKKLAEHIAKLEEINKSGGFSSSVEREIRTYKSQLAAIKQLLKSQ